MESLIRVESRSSQNMWIKQAVDDKAVVQLLYEGREVPQTVDAGMLPLLEKFLLWRAIQGKHFVCMFYWM